MDELRVTGLSAGYPGRPVIENLSLPVLTPGEVLALIGPNAAGKSTLLRAIAGLHPASGTIDFGGRKVLDLSLADKAKIMTYMPQTLPQRVALSVLETVISALRAVPGGDERSTEDYVRRAMAVLHSVGIAHLANDGLDRLSGGQRQLASLAQALARDPRVLLLDEPTSALDLRYQHGVMRLIRTLTTEKNMIAIMVVHDLALAAHWADRVVVLSHGRVAASGTPEQAITPAILAEVYGVTARIERCSRGLLQIMVDDVIA